MSFSVELQHHETELGPGFVVEQEGEVVERDQWMKMPAEHLEQLANRGWVASVFDTPTSAS